MSKSGDDASRAVEIGGSPARAAELGLISVGIPELVEAGLAWGYVLDARMLKELLGWRRASPREFDQLLVRMKALLLDGLRPPNIKPVRSTSGLVEVRTSGLRVYCAMVMLEGRCVMVLTGHGVNSGSKKAVQEACIRDAKEKWKAWCRAHRSRK